MTIGSREHYEILDNFEKHYEYERLDKEDKELWYKGHIYKDGEVNKVYKAFELGYSFGRANYINS